MHGRKIEITFNGMKEAVPENATISDLIQLTQEKDSGLIVEINNKFVFPQQYPETVLSDGDKVEFINPDFGG
ncbi:MAG: sulfur carrier protein ThiS [Syntrophorhabdus sp. PtaU1.Bin058]|nr:MAG: sulfur carrier protein ThiS [Syntrophorhabdus sp. PtaU1.Bin058]